MALIFSSGGGRLGNQLLNLIHLSSISFEYDINVYKVNDNSLISRESSLFFKIEKNNIKWKIVKDSSKIKKIRKLFNVFFVKVIHLYHYLIPNKKSYTIGLKNNLPKFILSQNKGIDYPISTLIKEAQDNDVVLSGWGLRDWQLVLKHKDSIIEYIFEGLIPFINLEQNIESDFLFVHIRRTDFLGIKEFDELNFSDNLWVKSIIKICEIESLTKVVIFSDSRISNYMVSSLEKNKINIFIANTGESNNSSFLELFITYLYYSKSVICNSSSLVLSLSFLFHEKIYLPSKVNLFQNIFLNNAHNSYPCSLNWK